MYHSINVLLPSGNKDQSNGQLSIYDPIETAERRVKMDPGLENQLAKRFTECCFDAGTPIATRTNTNTINCKIATRTTALRWCSAFVRATRLILAATMSRLPKTLQPCSPATILHLGAIFIYTRPTGAFGDTHDVNYLDEYVDPIA